METQSFVYMWINQVNGKAYVGSHVGHLDDGYIGSGRNFNLALKKYGKDKFFRVILFLIKGNERKYILEQETFFIQSLRLKWKCDLYNINNNASGGWIRTKASIEKQVKSITGRKHSAERVAKRVLNTQKIFSKRMRGWYNTPYGCFISSKEAEKYDPNYSYRSILSLCKENKSGYSFRSVK